MFVFVCFLSGGWCLVSVSSPAGVWNFSHDALPSLLDAFLAVTGSAESIGFSVRVCVFLRSFVEREREEFPKQIRGCDGLMMQLTEGKIHPLDDRLEEAGASETWGDQFNVSEYCKIPDTEAYKRTVRYCRRTQRI